MEIRLLVVVCLLGLVSAIHSKSVKSKPGVFEDTYGELVEHEEEGVQNDDYDDYNDENPGGENGEAPEEHAEVVSAVFETQPQEFIGHVGDTIKLPCKTSNEDVIMVWKKDDVLLYQSDFPIEKLPNIKKTSEGLEVNITSTKDFGQYSCHMMISEDNTPSIVHKIVPETPPQIVGILTEGNKTVYRIGETLKLTCLTTGHPKPKISWWKDNERLGNEGENITIPDLKFKHSGNYRCFADNKIEPPAHKHITINVEHKPIVSIDKYIVSSDKENDAELKCTVRAYPTPSVIWKKNGVNIVADPPKIELRRHQNNVENILMIRNLTEDDFGVYTCSAKNNLDKVERSVSLVKTPAVGEFVKPDKASKDVVLTWKVESKAPVIQHELQYRKKGENKWTKVNPEVKYDGNELYTLKYELNSLEPGSYETRARSRNSHGWSEYSDVMPFEGVLAKNGLHHKHNKKHHKESREKQVHTTSASTTAIPQGTPAQHLENEAPLGASETSGSSASISSMYLTGVTLLMFLCHRQ